MTIIAYVVETKIQRMGHLIVTVAVVMNKACRVTMVANKNKVSIW
jgi:hypothetical protein